MSLQALAAPWTFMSGTKPKSRYVLIAAMRGGCVPSSALQCPSDRKRFIATVIIDLLSLFPRC